MSFATRRALLKWLSVLAPGLAAATGSATGGPSARKFLESFETNRPEAILAIGAWLSGSGVTLAALDESDPSGRNPTDDIRASFARDPLINAGGLLLPSGFCRFCLAAHDDRIGVIDRNQKGGESP